MAYVSVSEWRPEQVTEWLKGLDICVTPYLHWFLNNEVSGQQLLNLSPDELTHLGVYKIGHQELILQAVEHLRNFHYELDRENLQLLALRVSCAAHSLYNEIKHKAETTSVPTQTMADVCNVINHVKPLVSWLDRPPFSGQIEYADYKSQLLSISLEMATCAQRDTFAERPISEIRNCSSKLFKLADSIIQDIKDPMLLQPASLDLATIKKRVGEDLGFFLIPSFYGIHQISEMKLSSPAHQSGKIQTGDEVVQVNYQTVVGWSRKKVLALFDESPNDLLLTLKRRPRHVKMYGQIYMKPYRLPSRKRASPYSRWNDNVQSPRPELLTLPHFDIPKMINNKDKSRKNEIILSEPSGTSSSSDEEFGQASHSQNSVSLRLYLPEPRAPIQRRFTLSGPPQPSLQSEQFWRELQLERSWRSNQNNSHVNNCNSESLGKDEGTVDEMFPLRDKSASLGNSIAATPARPATCIPFSKTKFGSVKFNLSKVGSSSCNSGCNKKHNQEERDKSQSDNNSKSSSIFSSTEKCIFNVTESANKVIVAGNKMSISELNKIKRDAFFNNMECTGTAASGLSEEDSSKKVKRIIENFKSEISNIKIGIPQPDIVPTPGKVSQLIGSFERQEIQHKGKFWPDRSDSDALSHGCWDKERHEENFILPTSQALSCDVPKEKAGDEKTDTLEEVNDGTQVSDGGILKNEGMTNFNDSGLFSDEIENFQLPSKSDGENHGQMVKTINDCLLPDTDFYSVYEGINYVAKGSVRLDEDDISSGSNMNDDYNKKTGEIIDTVQPALVELKQKQDHCELKKKQKEEGKALDNEFVNDISLSVKYEEKTSELLRNTRLEADFVKPVPAERKNNLQDEKQILNSTKNACIEPLPPKPQLRTIDKSNHISSVKPPVKSRTPPEPPPRPESTFSKVLNSKRSGRTTAKKENSDVDGDIRKGKIVISNPLSLTAEAFESLQTLSADIILKTQEDKQVPCPITSSRQTLKSAQFSRATSSSVFNVMTDKPKTSGSTFESLRAMLSLGRKPMSFSSPRTVRKKNAMLARKRNVSVKDVTPCDSCGMLWYRNRKGTTIAPWSKYFFVLQGPNFYAFKTKDSQKADLFIHLPGSTCTSAEEVKSKDFAFKIYHTGTAFYFAANSKEELHQWIDSVSQATICPDEKQIPETVIFSVSDSDSSDTEFEPETCFPKSPKMKKFLGSPVPKPARSHQNLASDSKKTYDIQKRFGSLKKLSSQKHSLANHNLGANETSNNSNAEITSLDRKYLRFLGQKNTPTPVPTSQFRSYRRMQPPASRTDHGKINEKNENSGKSPLDKDRPGLVRKTLHLSNPSLIHPDMADYRITQERLAEFRRLRYHENTLDAGGFMTLEQFMLSRQEDEASTRSNRSRPPELRGFMTLEQFLLRQEEERQRLKSSNCLRGKQILNEFGNDQQNHLQEEKRRKTNVGKMARPYDHSEATCSAGADNLTESLASECKNLRDTLHTSSGATSVNTKHNSIKGKEHRKYSSVCQEKEEEGAWLPCELTSDGGSFEKNNLRNPTEDDIKIPDCSHFSKDPTPDYPGIEYPPAFEPETYTLQYMLKNRRKRNANKSKGETK